MIRTILVDDEKPALSKLQHLLAQYPDYEIVGSYTDPFEVINHAMDLDPQVAFLDISMPGLNGIELASRMKKVMGKNIKIIFITAYNSYAVSAFDVQAVDYLMKPVSRSRFKQTIDLLDDMFRNLPAEPSSETQVLETGSEAKVRLFGKLEIIKDNKTISQWRTAKVRELFALYLNNRPEGIYRDEILNRLWGDISPDKALANLNTCNYYLRTFLNKIDTGISLNYSASYYQLDLGKAVCDADLFIEAEKQSEHISSDTIASVLSGAELYRGRYLEDVKCSWANLERDKFASLYSKIRSNIASFYQQKQLFDEAVAQAILSLNNNKLNQEAWKILIDSYHAKGDTAAYQRSILEMRDTYMEKTGKESPDEFKFKNT